MKNKNEVKKYIKLSYENYLEGNFFDSFEYYKYSFVAAGDTDFFKCLSLNNGKKGYELKMIISNVIDEYNGGNTSELLKFNYDRYNEFIDFLSRCRRIYYDVYYKEVQQKIKDNEKNSKEKMIELLNQAVECYVLDDKIGFIEYIDKAKKVTNNEFLIQDNKIVLNKEYYSYLGNEFYSSFLDICWSIFDESDFQKNIDKMIEIYNNKK